MAINLNRQPYFDDFDKDNNFVKILFKPSRPVQVRELNQLQSIQKHQLQLFANHIFKDGSKIEGRTPTENRTSFVTITPTQKEIKLLLKNGAILRGDTSGVEAIVLHFVDAVFDSTPATIYLNYTKTGSDNITHEFIEGEKLYILVNDVQLPNTFISIRNTNTENTYLNYPALGKGVIWKISESIFYTHGYFVEVQPSIVVGEAYDVGTESYAIGFDVQEAIVDINDAIHGDSLYDNALGYPNFVAPGADRLKINLILTKQHPDTNQTENFILLVKVENGIPSYIKSRTEYSTIMETLAERTYDESGNYSVSPISIKFRDHLKRDEYDSYGLFYPKLQGENDGDRIFGDENKFVAIISPIKAYIKGYLTETISETKIVLDKARDIEKTTEFYDRFNSLNYVLIVLDEKSCLSPNALNDTSIFSNKPAFLTNEISEYGVPAGDIIGTITVYDVEKDRTEGTTTFYRLYFTDISFIGNNTAAQVKTIYLTSSTYFLASLVNNTFTVYNNNQKTLIRKLGKSSVYSLKDVANNTNGLDYELKRRLFSTVNNNKLTFNAINGEVFDEYNPTSSFICLIEPTSGECLKIVPFSNDNFISGNTAIEIDFGDNSPENEKYAILYQKTIKRNNPPKIKYLKVDVVEPHCSIDLATGSIDALSKYTDLLYISSIVNDLDPDGTNIVDNFQYFDGITDTAYIPATLVCSNLDYLNSLRADPPNVTNTFEVTFTYYDHSSSGDYFSIDSYKNIIDDLNIQYGYEDVPVYISNDQTRYDLSDCLDFRPDILTTDKIQVNRPALNGVFNCNISYYLPRVDYIVLRSDGAIYQKKGKSSETPKPPKLAADDSEMALMLLKMKPYVYDVRTDVVKTAIDNKRYTMRDIGKLEKRIDNLEYYTSFTLLEMQTENASIKDENGQDRYKNGFIAENFQDFQIADIQNTEFKSAHDKRYQELRPAAFPYSTDLELNPYDSLNYKKIGNKIIIDFDEEPMVIQPFSSKSISLNPYFVYETKGVMKLFPDSDNWIDTNFLPELSVLIDTGIYNLIPSEPVIETIWGDWNTFSETNITATDVITEEDEKITTVTNINAKSQQREGIEITSTFDKRVDAIDMGVRISDAELMTYARPMTIDFIATNLKPNTRVYPFYDDMPVSDSCYPWKIDAQFNDPLISNEEGVVIGVFEIPEKTFFTGQKVFRLTNEINNDKDQDTLLTSAESKFWSGGLALTKQGTTLNVNSFDLNITDEGLTQNKVTVEVTSEVTTENVEPVYPPWCTIAWGCRGDYTDFLRFSPNGCFYDPLAQTFYNEISCFITSIEIFFDTVGFNDNIWIQIKNTENGYPGTIVYGETMVSGDTIETSNDASIPTKISLPFPVFIEGGKEYAIVVGAFTPDSRIYCSLLGKNDLTVPELLINSQPNIGSLFKSQNNSTWTASQYEDMKIIIHRAHFKHDYLLAVLENKISTETITAFNPFETAANSKKIRVFARNHGLSRNDRVKFYIGEKTVITLSQMETELPVVNIGVGQIIIAFNSSNEETGRATVKSKTIRYKRLPNEVDTITCELTNIYGVFGTNDYITTEPIERTLTIEDWETIAHIYSGEIIKLYHPTIKASISQIKMANSVTTNNTLDYLNGIPNTTFDTYISVNEVDSIDTFIVDVGVLATETGRCGGNVKFLTNRRYELFNISGAYSSIDCNENWIYYGLGHENNYLFTNDDYRRLEGKTFKPYTDVFLKQPYKFATDENESQSGKSIAIYAEFLTGNEYVSPVLDISTFNAILVSNRVDFVDPEEMNIEPNAIGRYIAETDPSLGSEVFKYVTKNIALKNSALDLKIFVDVYKPIYTDFDIYLKVQPIWDYTPIDTKPWIKLDPLWKDFTSKDLTDYREVQILTNEIMPELFGVSGSIGEFSSFKLKIVGKARNSANPPLFRRLRAIALT